MFIKIHKLLLFTPLFLIAKTEVFFSFDFDSQGRPCCTNLSLNICQKISQVKSRLWIAMYAFTNKDIAIEIIKLKAQRPSVDLKIIVDEFSLSQWGKVNLLVKSGIEVRVFDKSLFLKSARESYIENKIKSLQARTDPTLEINKDLFQDPEKVVIQEPDLSKAIEKSFLSSIMHNKYAILDDTVWFGSYNFTQGATFRNAESAAFSNSRRKAAVFSENFKGLLAYTEPYVLKDPVESPKVTRSQKPKKVKDSNDSKAVPKKSKKAKKT